MPFHLVNLIMLVNPSLSLKILNNQMKDLVKLKNQLKLVKQIYNKVEFRVRYHKYKNKKLRCNPELD